MGMIRGKGVGIGWQGEWMRGDTPDVVVIHTDGGADGIDGASGQCQRPSDFEQRSQQRWDTSVHRRARVQRKRGADVLSVRWPFGRREWPPHEADGQHEIVDQPLQPLRQLARVQFAKVQQ